MLRSWQEISVADGVMQQLRNGDAFPNLTLAFAVVA